MRISLPGYFCSIDCSYGEDLLNRLCNAVELHRNEITVNRNLVERVFSECGEAQKPFLGLRLAAFRK
jgi:hypothetical protein